jgi:hypothetical protein
MRKFPIAGLGAHPQRDALFEYMSEEVPGGPWTGRLDFLAWGKSMNLLCYFTDMGTGKRYRMSTFGNLKYKPAKDGPEFDKEEPGTGRRYVITTEPTRTGLAKFLTASFID